MAARFIVIAAAGAYLATACGWTLMASAQWNVWVMAISGAPLWIMLALMLRRRPVEYFYAALLLMPYLATAISQLMVGTVGRSGATLCLAAGLVYLALLALALRVLNRT